MRFRRRLRRPCGSSPLTRGKRLVGTLFQERVGLIPAHAGKTTVGDDVHFGVPAHPRSRGENHLVPGTTFWYRGSSPLTRGKPTVSTADRRVVRLIPAHAGKTMLASESGDKRVAHPRSRGENPGRPLIHDTAVGSSPLTRGKLATALKPAAEKRLIPAHAGKTALKARGNVTAPAHPRSRGENYPACST